MLQQGAELVLVVDMNELVAVELVEIDPAMTNLKLGSVAMKVKLLASSLAIRSTSTTLTPSSRLVSRNPETVVPGMTGFLNCSSSNRSSSARVAVGPAP